MKGKVFQWRELEKTQIKSRWELRTSKLLVAGISGSLSPIFGWFFHEDFSRFFFWLTCAACKYHPTKNQTSNRFREDFSRQYGVGFYFNNSICKMDELPCFQQMETKRTLHVGTSPPYRERSNSERLEWISSFDELSYPESMNGCHEHDQTWEESGNHNRNRELLQNFWDS